MSDAVADPSATNPVSTENPVNSTNPADAANATNSTNAAPVDGTTTAIGTTAPVPDHELVDTINKKPAKQCCANGISFVYILGLLVSLNLNYFPSFMD